MLTIKRIYDAPAKEDGYRILVDRLWPRGISKDRAHLYRWEKEIAPSTVLRTEFAHDAEKFTWFKHAYIHELDRNAATEIFIKGVGALLARANVTLLYAARDPWMNHAVVLKEYLEKKLH